jgi:alpha-beta hydrolase superfamily lysophospholipase
MSMTHVLDMPMVTDHLFHVRKTPPHTHPNPDKVKDGTVAVAEDVEIGYRLYLHTTTAPLLLYFHGNGEIATDYEGFAPYYHVAGVSLLVVDYRGYGWSTGLPKTTQLLPDAQKVFDALATIHADCGLAPDRPVFVKGRSLGSAPAIYLARQNSDQLKGLIVESGYSDAPSLFRRLGIPVPDVPKRDITLPLYNADKMRAVTLPLLVIHGGADTLIPVTHGRELFAASPVVDKELLVIDGAGHNDLLMRGTAKYFDAVRRFVQAHN